MKLLKTRSKNRYKTKEHLERFIKSLVREDFLEEEENQYILTDKSKKLLMERTKISKYVLRG